MSQQEQDVPAGYVIINGWAVKVKGGAGGERPVPHMKVVHCRCGDTPYSMPVNSRYLKCLKCGGNIDTEVVVAPHVHPSPVMLGGVIL